MAVRLASAFVTAALAVCITPVCAQASTDCTVNGHSATTGTDGNDVIVCARIDADTVDAGAGDDTITVTGRWTSGMISAGDGADVVILDGKGTMIPVSGTIETGAGTDHVMSSDPARRGIFNRGVIRGGPGADEIDVDINRGTVDGGEGDDDITAGIHGDSSEPANVATVIGGAGDDTIDGGWMRAGAVVDAGSGNDHVNYSSWTDGTVDLGEGDDTAKTWLSKSGAIHGGPGDDNLQGPGDLDRGGGLLDGGPDIDRCVGSGWNKYLDCEQR